MSDAAPQGSLNARVAEEVRVALTRRRKSQRALADDLGVSHMWVNDRVNCVTDFSLSDLERIAMALDVSVPDLIPGFEAGVS
jgi:transcriptional regulator with XRE-family HTH domain